MQGLQGLCRASHNLHVESFVSQWEYPILERWGDFIWGGDHRGRYAICLAVGRGFVRCLVLVMLPEIRDTFFEVSRNYEGVKYMGVYIGVPLNKRNCQKPRTNNAPHNPSGSWL